MKRLTLLLACCLLAGACASASRAAGGDYVAVVGRTSSTHLKQQLPDIIARHGYRVYRSTESATQLYWETDWLRREVLPSEADAGVTAAMVQLIFDGRERGGVYTLQMRARSRTRTDLQTDWVGTIAPPELGEALGRLKLDLEAEFGTGVRRF